MNASTNKKLNGTGFRLVEVDKKDKKIPDGYESEITGFGSSSYNFTNLTLGRYKLEETTTIEGFAKPEPWYFNVVQDPKTLKLKIEFENKDKSIDFKTDQDGNPILDDNGNLQDVIVNNYPKIPLRFKKVTGEDKPLKDAYFTLKKVRESMDESSMSFDYYGNGNLKTLVKNDKTYSYLENGELDTINGEKVEDKARFDSISGATKKYYKSNVRSQENGEVSFADLDEGIYELIETDIPDGYEDATQQIRWIVEVKKGDDGLEVIYNKETEDAYYSKYYSKYYEETYKKNNFKTNNNFAKLTDDPDFQYKLINNKNTVDLKWKKYSGDKKSNLIKKYTRFDLIKVIPNPEPDKDGKVADPMDEKNALTGQSYGGTRNIAASDTGIFEVNDLSKGIYVLYETKAPEGYKLMDRQIVIKVYEDENENYKLKKKFYEIKEDSEGKKSLVENEKLSYIFVSDNKPFIDEDGYFYVNNREKPYLIMSKVDGEFNHINSGELELSLYKDPKDTKNTDTNIYTHTIKLGDSKYYKFPLGDIKTDVAYLLEETKAPAGYVKSKNKYKIKFKKEGTTIVPYLVGVVKPDGTDLKNKAGNLITDTRAIIPAGGLRIALTGTLANRESTFKIVNNKTEVEFTKVGKDTEKVGDKLVVNEVNLEKVNFYLEKQDQDRNYYPVTKDLEFIKKDDKGYYIEKANGEKDYGNVLNPVSIDSAYTFTSNKNGKFKIENLSDGFYQLIEPEAPKDKNNESYMKVQGAVKKFRILEGEVYIEDDKTESKLSEAKTEDKKRLTKITNEKPGKGEFELNKTDDENNPLEGVTFKLYDTEGKEVKTDITNSYGKIKFSDLPFGSYWLKEIKTKNGYIIDTKKRLIALGGGDWKVPDKKLNDVSKAITFDGVQEELVSTADTPNSQTVYPNKAEGMVANFKFNIDPEKEIKPGDYFTINFSNNIDLDGIYKDNKDNGKIPDSKFDIIGPAGKLAEAKVNDDRKSITYTFTDYVENYKPESMAMYLQIFADRRLIDHKQDIRVTADIGDNTDNENNDYHYSDSINIDYRGYNSKENYNGYQNPKSDISSYNLRLNPEDKTFTAIVYYNPWNKYLTNKNIRFTTDKEIDQESLSVKTYVKYGSGSHKNEWQKNDLPDSYDVDFNKSDLEYIGDQYRYMKNVDQYGYYNGNTNEILIPQNYLNEDGYEKNTYVIEIKGKLASDTAYSLNTIVHYADHNVYELRNDGWYYYEAGYTGHFETWSQFFNPGAIGDVTNEISLVNFKNKIEYTKINGGIRGVAVDKKEDQGANSNAEQEEFSNGIGSPLEGATFELRKKSELGTFTKVEGSKKTSDENGKFFWEKLGPGEYEVWETKAPEGFKTPDKAVSSFTVDKNGNIVKIKNGKLTIENNKNAQIKIRKTDLNGNTLEGASFLLTQETGSIEYGAKVGVEDKANNTIVFDDLPVGTYKLEEKRAPKGFIKSNKIWNIEVRKDGTVKWLNSFDDSKDTMSTIKNPSYLGENATNITSEVIGINTKDKIFRQKFTIKAKASDIKDKAITIESLANDIKLTDANTKIRLLASDDGKNISNKDNSSYKVYYDNESSNLKVTIKPESANEDKEKTYILMVDMPYKEATKVGAKITYNGQTVSRYLQSFTAEENPLDMSSYQGKYLDRDINKVELPISNKKGEYPFTGGPGVWIGFTIIGLVIMFAGVLTYYKRKYRLVIGEV